MNAVSQHIDGNGNTFSGSGDVQSNSFDSGGGTQNIAQGTNPIGQQNNYYLNQPAPPPIPNQRPTLEPCFLHREEELVWLNDRLHPGKVAAVCGPGGMGKSALAAQAVHQLEAARFPDGIIFHSFYHQPKVETALQAICAAFQVEAKAGLEAAVRNALSGRKALLILDGTEQADDLPALLRLRGTCGVLITSRKRSDALADRLDLKPLDEQPAAEVFRLYSGVAADDAGVQGICKLLGGWPVALRIAGRYLSTTGESAADYLKWLEQEPFKELAGGQHEEENAALLLRRSVKKVSEDAQFALNIIGALAFAPFTERSVVALLRINNYSTPWEFCRWLKTVIAHRRTWLLRCTDDDLRFCQVVLNELVAYGLLEKQDDGWKVSHALIHVYLRTKMPLNRWLLKGLARYYIAFCQEQSAAGPKGYAILDGERAHCLRLMESCLASKLLEEVKLLAWAIYEYLDRQGYWTEKLTAVGINLIAAQQAGNGANEVWCLNRLYCYEQSLPIWRKLEHKEGEGTPLNNIGSLYWAQGKYEQILPYYEQCLPITREAGDKHIEGATLNNIGLIYRAQGNPAKALEYLHQALAIRQQIGDWEGEAWTLFNIGVTYYDLGDLAKAEEYMSQAVQLTEAIGYPFMEKSREGLAQVRAERRA